MPGMHAQHADEGHDRGSGLLRWRQAWGTRARDALSALRPAFAPAGDEQAGTAGMAARENHDDHDGHHDRRETITVIPAAGEHVSLAQRWRDWRMLLAWARRGPARSEAHSEPRARQPMVPLLPAPWFRAARRWSPGLFPPGLALLLLGALALAGHLGGRGAGIIPPTDILPLALIYLIGGTLYGVALYFAPTNNIWLGVLAGGALLYLLATLWVLAGPLAVVAVAVLLCVPTYLYMRHHLCTVPAGQAVATTLAGGYHRTLAPGTKVLIPGERTLAAVDTGDRQIALPTERVRITDPDGESFVARAAATLAYHVTPGQAHLAALAAETWEGDLELHATQSLRAALGEWGHRLLDGEELPERFLARTILDDLRPRVRPDGMTILWVNVRDIWLTPESEVIPVAEWDQAAGADGDDERAPHAPVRRDAAGAYRGDPAPHLDHQGAAPRPPAAPHPPAAPSPPAALPSIDDAHLISGDSEPLEREALAPDALADAYDAVRDGHIADPETIRAIANAFLAVAADPELADAFPYDAVAAARILMQRAAALERAGLGGGNRSP